jgi:hypothetical protein
LIRNHGLVELAVIKDARLARVPLEERFDGLSALCKCLQLPSIEELAQAVDSSGSKGVTPGIDSLLGLRKSANVKPNT